RWRVHSFVSSELIDVGCRLRVIETGSIVRHDVLALEKLVKRPKKSLHPLVLSIQAFLFAARSLCSVVPTVRQCRGVSEIAASERTESGSPGAAAEGKWFFMCASAR